MQGLVAGLLLEAGISEPRAAGFKGVAGALEPSFLLLGVGGSYEQPLALDSPGGEGGAVAILKLVVGEHDLDLARGGQGPGVEAKRGRG